jgi:hypothetical protein
LPEEALKIAIALRVLSHDTKKKYLTLNPSEPKTSDRLISTIGLGKTNEQLGDSMVCYIAPALRQFGFDVLNSPEITELL